MARRNGNSRKRDDDIGMKMLRGAMAGCAVAGAVVFGIVAMIGIIVAIKFNEARRHGVGPFAGQKIEIDPPPVDPPPIIQPPPIERPPVVIGPPNMIPANIGPDGFARTHIVGGGGDPQFEDKAPPGGVLIGLELAVVNNDAIKSIRPIYLAQGKEFRGTQVGNEKLNVVLKAKQGYAVSALNVNAGLWLDGMSLTFARLNNGKLNLNETYPSPYYGGDGGGRSVHGGNGMLVVGVIGKRASDNSANGIGLLLK
jgi:hypothetical protein